MEDGVQRTLGRHEGRLDGIEGDISEIKEDIRAIRDATDGIKASVNQARGGWKVILIIASVAGSFGAVTMKVFAWLAAVPVPR